MVPFQRCRIPSCQSRDVFAVLVDANIAAIRVSVGIGMLFWFWPGSNSSSTARSDATDRNRNLERKIETLLDTRNKLTSGIGLGKTPIYREPVHIFNLMKNIQLL